MSQSGGPLPPPVVGAGAGGAGGVGGTGGSGGVGDWRKGSADIKLLLKNLYSQSPMPHTDVTFKVLSQHCITLEEDMSGVTLHTVF